MLTRFFNGFEIQTRLALVSATSVCLASLAAFAMHLGAPWWAAISAWIVAHTDTERWWAKSSQRVLASLGGSFAGYHLTLWTESDPFLQALCVFSLGTLGIYKRLTSPEHSYAWLLGTLTAVIIVLTGIENIQGLFNIAIERAVEVSVGVIVAGAVTGIFAQHLQQRESSVIAPSQLTVASANTVDSHTYSWILAIAGGFAITLAPVISGLIQLPGLTQFAITIGVCMNGQSYQIRHIGYQRILGCLSGGLVGIGMLTLNIESLFIYLSLIFTFIFVASGVHHGERRWAAIGTQAGVAFMICTLAASGPVESILPAVHRFVGILCALVTVTILTVILEVLYMHHAGQVRPHTT